MKNNYPNELYEYYSFMRQAALILAICGVLTGCVKAQTSASKALDDVEGGTSTTWGKVREALDFGSPQAKPQRHAQPRYCYKAYEDIICYSKPLAGQESRLIAYQAGNEVGYVIPPPAPQHAKPHVMKKAAVVAQNSPANSAAPVPASASPSLTPVPGNSVTPAPQAKPAAAPVSAEKKETKTDQKKLKEILFDPSELEPKKLVPDKME